MALGLAIGIGPTIGLGGPVANTAPQFIEYEDAYNNGATAQTVDIPAPTSVIDGDLMVAIIGSDTGDVGTPDVMATVPTGWTLRDITGYNTTIGTVALYTKVASSESGTYDWVWTSSDPTSAFMWVIRGGVYEGFAVSAPTASTSHVCPTVTTTQGNSMVLQALMADRNSTYTAPVTATVQEAAPHGGTAGFGHGAAYEIIEDASVVGTRTWTYGSTRYYGAYQIVIKPTGT